MQSQIVLNFLPKIILFADGGWLIICGGLVLITTRGLIMPEPLCFCFPKLIILSSKYPWFSMNPHLTVYALILHFLALVGSVD